MRARRRPSRLLNIFCLFAGMAGFCTSSAFADVQNSSFVISPDGATVAFDVHDVPRREVFERLFADRGIKIEWLSRSFADEPISGRFHGAHSDVARNLLAQTNFVIVNSQTDGRLQISRIVVIGQVAKDQVSPGLRAIETGLQPGRKGNAPGLPSLGVAAAGTDRPMVTPTPAGILGPIKASAPAAIAGPKLIPIPPHIAAPPSGVGPMTPPAGSNGPVPFPGQAGATAR